MTAIDAKFHRRCVQAAEDVEAVLGHPRSYFLQGIAAHGAVEETRRLINAREASSTFNDLWVKGNGPRYLTLTVEAVILDPEWDDLCVDVDALRERARTRLLAHGVDPGLEPAAARRRRSRAVSISSCAWS